MCGGSVVGTISSGILNLSLFNTQEGMDEYSLLMFCTMGGAFMWLAIATYLKAPVSTTHSLIGSLIGSFQRIAPNENSTYWRNTMVIELENIDGKIWKLEEKIVDIISIFN
jgi:phosphate/sulfate permease